jgi:hypothetical protein
MRRPRRHKKKHEGKQHRNKTQMENTQCEHVEKGSEKKQRSRNLRAYENNYPTQLKMAM